MIKFYLILKLSQWVGRRLRGAFYFIQTIFMVFWQHAPDYADQMATHWAIVNQSPERMYWVYLVLAWASIVVGWVILSFITVAIWRIVF